ncbi:tetratricopeptide repeat family protein [Bordetella bronchiseptica]|nr:tetratricopeptide repeat family protein [Bordetella bronchiseptica]
MQRTPAGRPQLIVWENLHWMDPASLGLIEHLAGRVVSGPTLLLATARDVYAPVWDHQAITVPPLDREATAQLAASLARTYRLSQGQRAQVQQESMGNPLYAGELARCAAQLALPQGVPSLADRVALQLNLLAEPERHALQMLCLLCGDAPADAGRLAEVLQTAAAALATRLETLGRHGLLDGDANQGWRCPPPIAQAVRRYMLREQRGALHQRIAQHLQQNAGAPHEIARHLQQAGDPQAAQWWRTAVWEVVRRGDYAQAHRYLDNALALRQQIESDAERDEFEFACHMVRGELAGNLDGPGSMAAAQAYTLAVRVSPGDPQSRFTALWALWNTCQHSGDYDEAVSLSHQLLNMANEHGKSGWRTWALYAMAICELWKGDVIESERLLRQALHGLVFPHTDIGPAPILGENAGALIHAMLALTVATQGRGDEAMQSVQTAMAYAQQDNNPLMLATSSMMLVKFSYLYEDWAQMGMVAGALKQSMDAHPLRPQFLYALTSCYVDLAAALQGDASVLDNFEPALETIRRALPTAEVAGQCLLACALNALGRPDRALLALDRADLLCARFRIAGMMPETLCLRGDALLLLGDLEQACAAWRQAIGHANRLAALQYARWAQRRLDANQLVPTGQ